MKFSRVRASEHRPATVKKIAHRAAASGPSRETMALEKKAAAMAGGANNDSSRPVVGRSWPERSNTMASSAE